MTGANVWKHADSLEAVGRKVTRYFLTSPGGRARGLADVGALVTGGGAPTAPDYWTHDPLDVAHEDPALGLVSPASALDLRGRGVVYETSPLPKATEISGIPSLTLWLTIDVPDADLAAEIHEITPDGKSILLNDTRLRARYRTSRSRPELLSPGQPTRVVLDRFRFMSRLVAAGSRIRLVVRTPATSHLEVNYHSGGAVAFETARDARTARIALHHEPGMESALTLPMTAVSGRAP